MGPAPAAKMKRPAMLSMWGKKLKILEEIGASVAINCPAFKVRLASHLPLYMIFVIEAEFLTDFTRNR